MKIRNGWVGNSSSSSFLIIGKYYEYGTINNEDITDILYRDKIKLNYEYGIFNYDSNDLFVGLYYNDMKPNETRLEFEKRILQEIQKFDPTAKLEEIEIFEDGGYNG